MAQELAKHKVPRKGFEEAFEQAVKRWVSGEYDHEYREPWPEFKLRVETAFDNLVMGAAKSENILVFTSGGPISVICGKILGLDTRGTFSINQNLANAGVTRALYSANRVSLTYFNNFSHLEQEGKGLLTYR
jgi:broad specificity phosphatase PhoE